MRAGKIRRRKHFLPEFIAVTLAKRVNQGAEAFLLGNIYLGAACNASNTVKKPDLHTFVRYTMNQLCGQGELPGRLPWERIVRFLEAISKVLAELLHQLLGPVSLGFKTAKEEAQHLGLFHKLKAAY